MPYSWYDLKWKIVLDLAIENKLNTKTTIERLDTYSLGITLTKLLYDFLLKTFDHLNDYDLYLMIKDVFDCEKFKSVYELLRDMTEPLSSNRISPDIAYSRYKSIYQ